MALKDVNILEKHAEKMVLGAAAAGALFMGYLATQKITTENDIAPKEVQSSIQKKVFGDPEMNQTPENPAPGTLLYVQKEIEKLGEPVVKVPDYVGRFNAEARDRPLPQAVVTTVVPQIGPANMAPGAKTGVDDNKNWALAAPEPVPGVEMLHVEAKELDVADNPLALGVTLPPGAVLNVKGKKAVVIEGYIPVGEMTLQMLSVKDVNRRIPADRNHAVIQNIHVQRAELKPGGGQTAWEDVKPAKTSATPPQIPAWDKIDDVVPAMNTIDQQFKEIVLPDFHQDAQGVAIPPAILTKPLPDKIIKKIDELHAAIEAAKLGASVAAARGGPATPAVTGVRPTITDAQSAKALEVVPFTFWDENVEAGHRYRYKVSVEYVNPVFGWAWGLAKPAQKTQGVLASADVVSEPVKIDSDVEFFVMNGSLGGKDSASIRIFKKISGKWYKNDLSTPVGTRIAGKVPRPDETPIQYVPVETSYTIVDVVQAGGEVRVVLRDADGSLTTRDSATDRTSPDMKRLTEESTTRPAATQADTQPGAPTPPPTRGGPTPVPTTGRSTPIPTNNPPRRGN